VLTDLVGRLKGIGNTIDTDVDGRVILRIISEKTCVRMWT
jgi:hypothetical protein